MKDIIKEKVGPSSKAEKCWGCPYYEECLLRDGWCIINSSVKVNK